MGLFDSLLGQISSNVDVQNLAEKVGLSPEQAEQAIGALGEAHGAPGDMVETAAAQTGLSSEVLQQIVGHLGGEGALGHFAGLLQNAGGASGLAGMLDRDEDGNPLNDLGNLASSFFKR